MTSTQVAAVDVHAEAGMIAGELPAQVHETHSGVVILIGDKAYKTKKWSAPRSNACDVRKAAANPLQMPVVTSISRSRIYVRSRDTVAEAREVCCQRQN